MAGADRMISVEVAYARAGEQAIIPVDLPEGSSVAEALLRSRIQERFPEIDLTTAKVGIFGKLSQAAAVLRNGDRIEIYRPLMADPTTVRRRRAARAADLSKKEEGRTENH